MDRATPMTEGARIGRFVVVRPLGAGGMGAVYEARDPELARSVALKLLHEDAPELAMRLLREAQALAQLQHPNVVAVHELDLHEDRVFIAMELVVGENLDRYLERTRPDWRGTVALFVQVGRGLAAAHDKGIVHRDVKPSNLFVDESGRVRVGDFGLARITEEGGGAARGDDDVPRRAVSGGRDGETPRGATTGGDPPTDSTKGGDEASRADDSSAAVSGSSNLLGSPLTRAGAVLGTPYFMAPEQHEGRRATPATDQFSFCVALWLALFNEHPFDGPAAGGLAKAVAGGVRRPSPARRGVPRGLVRAIERGLAVRPQDRHPSMAALVAELEARSARRGATLAIAGGGVAVAAVAITVAVSARGVPAETCDDAGADRAWSLERRAALAGRFQAARPATGADTAARTVIALDAYRDRWRSARAAACTREPALRDRTAQCLERVAEQLRVVTGAFEQATGPVVDRAIDLVAGLPVPETCAAAALSTAMPLTADPRVEAVTATIARARVNVGTDERKRVLEELAGALKTAEELGHPGLLAEARMVAAELGGNRTREQITKELETALGEAKRAGDRALEADITVRMLERVTLDRNVQAIESMLPITRAAVAASPDNASTQLRFARAEADATLRAGRHPEALKACDRIAQVEPEPKVQAATCRCGTLMGAAKLREAKTACEGSLAAAEAYYGADTAATQPSLSNLANMLRKVGDYEASRKLRERSLKLSEAIFEKDSEHMAIEHYSLGLLLVDTGKLAEARRELEASLAIFARGERPTERMANVQMQLAKLREREGDSAGAADAADKALELTESALGPEHPTVVLQLLAQGNVNVGAKRYEVALASFRRGAAIATRKLGGTHLMVGLHQASEAQVLIAQGKPRDAIPICERAVSVLVAANADPLNTAGTCAICGQALLELGERDKGRAELEKARAIYTKLGPGSAHDLKIVDALLEKYK